MDWSLAVARKNTSWREGRRLLDRSLRPGATMSYRRVMEEKTRTFLAKLLEDPKPFSSHIELSVFRVRSVALCRTINGYTVFKEALSCP
jgi:hypothetical protein